MIQSQNLKNTNKTIFESYSKEEAMGVRDIWENYAGRKGAVSGGVGESK